MEDIDIDNFYIELLEECPCENIEQLRKREGHFIREIGTLNKQVAGRNKEEYRTEHKDYLNNKIKEWNEHNKEHCQQYAKEYRLKHKEHKTEYAKEYNIKHKERLSEQKKVYYAKRIDELRKQVVSECGTTVSKQCLNKHLKTSKHKTLLQELNKSSE